MLQEDLSTVTEFSYDSQSFTLPQVRGNPEVETESAIEVGYDPLSPGMDSSSDSDMMESDRTEVIHSGLRRESEGEGETVSCDYFSGNRNVPSTECKPNWELQLMELPENPTLDVQDTLIKAMKVINDHSVAIKVIQKHYTNELINGRVAQVTADNASEKADQLASTLEKLANDMKTLDVRMSKAESLLRFLFAKAYDPKGTGFPDHRKPVEIEMIVHLENLRNRLRDDPIQLAQQELLEICPFTILSVGMHPEHLDTSLSIKEREKKQTKYNIECV